jgi:hypothetical protein
MNLTSILSLLLLLPTLGVRAEETIDESTPARAIASLTDPKKLATLKGERASNPRLQKCLYWIEVDQRTEGGLRFYGLINRSLELNGEKDTPYGNAILGSLFSNYSLACDMGLFTSEGMNELRQGKSATITKGEYVGQEATADHYIPRSVCPELDNQIYNLLLLPSKLNSSKGDKVEKKQVKYAEELNKGGLLSAEGLEAVRKAYEKEASAQPPQTAESEDEKQVRMNEESKQMELELVRAERKGTEAVYEVWVERLKKLGEQANKTKATSDILIYEKTLNSAMGIWERMFEENWNKNHPRPIKGDYELKSTGYERARNQEVAYLESFLDESLRAK